jgi:hypothetical protein
MKEAVGAFETSVYSETTRRYIPEGSNLHTRRRENLKSTFIYLFYLVATLFSNSDYIASNERVIIEL